MKYYNTEIFENIRNDLKMSITIFCKTFKISPTTYEKFLKQKKMRITTLFNMANKLNLSHKNILCST